MQICTGCGVRSLLLFTTTDIKWPTHTTACDHSRSKQGCTWQQESGRSLITLYFRKECTWAHSAASDGTPTSRSPLACSSSCSTRVSATRYPCGQQAGGTARYHRDKVLEPDGLCQRWCGLHEPSHSAHTRLSHVCPVICPTYRRRQQQIPRQTTSRS